jgi:hypothetical protein
VERNDPSPASDLNASRAWLAYHFVKEPCEKVISSKRAPLWALFLKLSLLSLAWGDVFREMASRVRSRGALVVWRGRPRLPHVVLMIMDRAGPVPMARSSDYESLGKDRDRGVTLVIMEQAASPAERELSPTSLLLSRLICLGCQFHPLGLAGTAAVESHR